MFNLPQASVMSIRKLLLLSMSICFMLLGVVARADDNSSYGIQSTNTTTVNNNVPPQQQTHANSAQYYRDKQQALINSLLQQAQSNNNAQSNNSNSATTQQAPQNTGLSDEAFADTVRNMMPLSPEQIKTLRELFDQSQRAAATAPGVPPKPTSTSIIVNLSPGATPPIIRLSAGFITSLVFVDSTGAPWPIKAFDLGDPQSFNVQWDQKGNTLLVQALRHYNSGNLAVMLKGLDTPVMLTLMPGQNAVDYRVDLRVPGLGPNADPMLDGLPPTESPNLLDVLNGVPPAGSRTLQIDGGDCQGWLTGDGHIYLRTALTVLSPGWISTMSSADGTHAYELQNTPVVLASQRGKLIKLTIEGL
jgi:intracellular multiplication protein IcmK